MVKGRDIMKGGLSKVDAFILSVRAEDMSLHEEIMEGVLHRTIRDEIKCGEYNKTIVDLSLYEANIFAKYMN